MLHSITDIARRRYKIWGVRLAGLLIIAFFVWNIFPEGWEKQLYSYRQYECQNEYRTVNAEALEKSASVSQYFTAEGNRLDALRLFVGETDGQKVTLALCDTEGETLASAALDMGEYEEWSWNTTVLSYDGLVKGTEYVLCVSSDEPLSFLYLSEGEEQDIYGSCMADNTVQKGSLCVDMQFTHTYIEIEKASGMAAEAVLLGLLLLFACYAVWNMEKLYPLFCAAGKKKGICYAAFCSGSLMLLYNPLAVVRNQVTEFDRTMGQSLMAGTDISGRVNHFYYWLFMFGFFFLLFWIAANAVKVRENALETRKMLAFLDNMIILADVSLLLESITYFWDSESGNQAFSYSSKLLLLLVVAAGMYAFADFGNKVKACVCQQLMLCVLVISFPVAALFFDNWTDGSLLLGIQTAGFALTGCFMAACGKCFSRKRIMSGLSAGLVLVCSLIPFLTSFYIEMLYILNQHEIFVRYPARYYGYGFAAVLIIAAVLAVVLWLCKLKVTEWRRWSYPWLVFGFACLSVQIPFQDIYTMDWFEGANYSVLISDFLNYGSLPLVEHYGGHMLTGVCEGIIYGIFNNDIAGAVFSPYWDYLFPVLAVIFYLFVRKVWDADIALWVTLLFPFGDNWNYFGLGAMVCLASAAYVKKNTFLRAVSVWAAVIFCALYRLDIGYAFGIACVAAMVCYIIFYRNWKAMRQLLLSLMLWAAAGCLLWYLLCVMCGADPLYRLAEFLMVSMSNVNWAYAGIGNPEHMVFAWCYIMIPFTLVAISAYTIFSGKFREELGAEKWMLLMVILFAYVANFSRGLVRHSLVEYALQNIIWSAYLAIAVFLSFKKKNRSFLPVFTLLILCNALFLNHTVFSAKPFMEHAVAKTVESVDTWTADGTAQEEEQEKTIWEQLYEEQKVVRRVEMEEGLAEEIEPYKEVLEVLLEEEDTFVDFMNKTILYAVLDKKNPVYVSQSPLQLSGEFTQEQFISQIEEVPLVLMPADSQNYRLSGSMDGLANAYRNYRVSEYIYKNYVPLCQYDNKFAVWCRKDRYEEMYEKAAALTGQADWTDRYVMCRRLTKNNCELSFEKEKHQFTIAYTEADPGIEGLEKVLGLEQYAGRRITISVGYNTNVNGIMQLFYTTEKNEGFSGEKSVMAPVFEKGIARFSLRPTEHTRLRLDTPEGSDVTISFMIAGETECSYIDYGYDGPDLRIDEEGIEGYAYTQALHHYELGYIPLLWAEHDEKDAAANPVLTELVKEENRYTIDSTDVEMGDNGNYLLLSATCIKTPEKEISEEENDRTDAYLIMGKAEKEGFAEKCRFGLTLKEGTHDYIIRVSADYYWHLGEIDTVRILCDEKLYDVSMKILEGD